MEKSEIQKAVDLVTLGRAVLLDVRRDDEWKSGHAKNALHFDSDRILGLGESPDIEKDTPMYVYCLSGGRAGRVKNELIARGYTQVHNLGGFSDWKAAGGEVELG